MGCSWSSPFTLTRSSKKAPAEEMPHTHHHHAHHALHKLLRPALYAANKRPSFAAAYARAARRYQFGPGIYPTFVNRNNLVYRIRAADDPGAGQEVPADSIQNGQKPSTLYLPQRITTLSCRFGVCRRGEDRHPRTSRELSFLEYTATDT
jgi:hypothetical protein